MGDFQVSISRAIPSVPRLHGSRPRFPLTRSSRGSRKTSLVPAPPGQPDVPPHNQRRHRHGGQYPGNPDRIGVHVDHQHGGHGGDGPTHHVGEVPGNSPHVARGLGAVIPGVGQAQGQGDESEGDQGYPLRITLQSQDDGVGPHSQSGQPHYRRGGPIHRVGPPPPVRANRQPEKTM